MNPVRLLAATLIPGTVLMYSTNSIADASEDRVEALDQKVKVLERKLELADEEAANKAKATSVASASDKGLSLKSADGNFELRLRGVLQVDNRTFLNDEASALTDTFLIRKARPIFEGTFAKYIDYRVMPDFAGSSVTLVDGYIDLKYVPAATVRVGKFKPPVSLIRLQSDNDAVFLERSLVGSLTTDRDIGVQVGGAVFDNTVNYALGVFNGLANNAVSVNDTNDKKDVAARLFFQPWFNSPGVLQGLGFGVGGTVGHQTGSADVGRLRSPGQADVFGYRSTVVADGNHTRVVPQLYFYRNNFGLLAEYAQSSQEVRTGTSTAKLEHTGWDVEVNWIVTGEDASYRGVKPAADFAPRNEGWGAVELGLRYGELNVDDAAFTTFADPAGSVTAGNTAGAVVNWYLNRNTRVSLDYEHTDYTGGAATGDRRPEKAIIGRLQLAY